MRQTDTREWSLGTGIFKVVDSGVAQILAHSIIQCTGRGVYRAGETARREIVGGSRRRCGRQAKYRDEMFRRPCNDPANPAQARPLTHMPERVFSCTSRAVRERRLSGNWSVVSGEIYGSDRDSGPRCPSSSFAVGIWLFLPTRWPLLLPDQRSASLHFRTPAGLLNKSRCMRATRSLSSAHACAAPFVNSAWWWGPQTVLEADQCRLSSRRITSIFRCA